jgi:hypothetical protein
MRPVKFLEIYGISGPLGHEANRRATLSQASRRGAGDELRALVARPFSKSAPARSRP